ncbi:serine--tRNA ligase [bacterium]|nr:serine--tRNA ligase [bacterium]
MLDIKFIRQNPQIVKEGCQKKHFEVDIDKLLELDKRRREILGEIEQLRHQRNIISEKKELNEEKIEKAKDIKKRIKTLENNFTLIDEKFNELMLLIPNLPLNDTPVGKDESDNVVIKKVGKIPKFDFKPKGHLEIGQNLNLIDVKRAAKVSGTRFGYLKNEAVLLEFALIKLAFDSLTKKGFQPIIPPVMMKKEMMRGMGYLEQTDREEAYYLKKDDLFLAGTAEQPIGTMHAEEIFEQNELPKRYLGFSTCFRREAGSYGKDTQGIFRVHQFDKVEMFSFCKPEESQREHKMFLSLEEELMRKLKIPYQIVNICTGDLGRPAAAKYDIEAWLPSESRYRETHSTSNCTDFQARRLNIRYRNKFNKLNFVHTVNGTAFAIGRTIIAILENYQRKDGKVDVPKVLQKYIGFKTIPQKR